MSSLVAVVCGRNVEALVFGSGSTVVVNARSELPRSKSRRVVYMCLYEALASKSNVINRSSERSIDLGLIYITADQTSYIYFENMRLSS